MLLIFLQAQHIFLNKSISSLELVGIVFSKLVNILGCFILPKVLWYIESSPDPIILTTNSSPSKKKLKISILKVPPCDICDKMMRLGGDSIYHKTFGNMKHPNPPLPHLSICKTNIKIKNHDPSELNLSRFFSQCKYTDTVIKNLRNSNVWTEITVLIFWRSKLLILYVFMNSLCQFLHVGH